MALGCLTIELAERGRKKLGVLPGLDPRIHDDLQRARDFRLSDAERRPGLPGRAWQ
jgi:hypothetical protein